MVAEAGEDRRWLDDAYAGADHSQLADGLNLLTGGMDVEGVGRQLGIADSTWVRWLPSTAVCKADDAKRLKELRLSTPG
jgi:hypothetical protein